MSQKQPFGFYFFDSLEGLPCESTEGDIGKTEDVLFYDHSGRIGYFVIKTGGWLSHRKVLVAPEGIDRAKARRTTPEKPNAIPTVLSREKIESSPPYESDRPVSDEYRKQLDAHYGWPQTVGAGGLTAPSVLVSEPIAPKSETAPDPEEIETEKAENLRSVREILQYRLTSHDSTEVGEISDAVLDRSLSALVYLCVKERDLLRPRSFILPWECIAHFDLASRSINTALERSILKNAPEAPAEDEFADNAVERAIRNYFNL